MCVLVRKAHGAQQPSSCLSTTKQHTNNVNEIYYATWQELLVLFCTGVSTQVTFAIAAHISVCAGRTNATAPACRSAPSQGVGCPATLSSACGTMSQQRCQFQMHTRAGCCGVHLDPACSQHFHQSPTQTLEISFVWFTIRYSKYNSAHDIVLQYCFHHSFRNFSAFIKHITIAMSRY